MVKRSREASFSPSTDPASSPVATPDSGFDTDEVTHPKKIATLSGLPSLAGPAMQCLLPPHRHAIDFASIELFEIHYAKEHSNRCVECDKNFPSDHFLVLHIDENHNPLREELQAKGGKTYGCFVEDCEKKCSTPQKRRLHLIDKHAFPKVYNFRVIDIGIDHSTSMLRESKSQRRRVSTTSSPADAATRHRRSSNLWANANGAISTITSKASQATTYPAKEEKSVTADAQLDDLADSMSSLRFVPASVVRQITRKPPK